MSSAIRARRKQQPEATRSEPGTGKTIAMRSNADLATRDQILMSAMQWFARRGFDGASVNQIASDAGVPQPLINYHFVNKLGLWTAVVDFLFEELLVELDLHSGVLKDLDPLDALKVTLRRHLEFNARRPEFFLIAIVEAREDTDRLRYLMERYINRLNRSMEGLILAAQRSGRIKTVPSLNLLEIMVGASMIFFGQSAGFRFSESFTDERQQLADRHADLMIDVLFDGLAVR